MRGRAATQNHNVPKNPADRRPFYETTARAAVSRTTAIGGTTSRGAALRSVRKPMPASS